MHGNIDDPVPGQSTLEAVRYRCRNQRCRSWLKSPSENPRDAFCCSGCYVGFYRTHCIVCEAPTVRKTGNQYLCGRRQCRNEFRRNPTPFLSGRYIATDLRQSDSKTPTISKPKTTIRTDRAWRVVAGPIPPGINLAIPLDSKTAEQTSRFNRRAIEAARAQWRPVEQQQIFQRDTPPLNVIGGYRFPGAPAVDLSPTGRSVTGAVATNSPDDLSIPDFLRRDPIKAADAT